jgi:glutamyl-tRNA reductase
LTRAAPSQLLCIGANHQTAPVSMRSELFIPAEALELSLPILRQKTGWGELMVLSTCNRFEIYAIAPVNSVHETDLVQAYIDLHTAAGRNIGYNPSELSKVLYVHVGGNAVAHAMKVAGGLDSLVVGETQITGQFKEAMQLARKCGTIGPMLARLEQESLSAAKAVRSQTDIGKRSVSVASAAIELISLVFGDLRKHDVLIIGAGDMARIAAEHLAKRNPRQIFIANRNVERAASLAANFERSSGFGLDNLEDLICRSDVVISATASENIIVSHSLMDRIHQRRKAATMCMVDIALPCDIEASVASFDGVYLFNIDDLRQVVDRNMNERRSSVDAALSIVQKSVQQFIRWSETQVFRPVLAEVDQYFEELLTRELKKSLSREPLKSLSQEQLEQLKIALTSIRSKLMSDIGIALKSTDGVLNRDQLVEALSVFFGETGPIQESSSGQQKSS